MRSAIILPLGVLNEKVDTSPFILQLIALAKQSNPNFEFTSIQQQAFALAEDFNKNVIDKAVFKNSLLLLFAIHMDDELFWQSWNSMVRVGNIKQIIANLKAFASEQDLVFYLHSDTNLIHLDIMQRVWEEQKIHFYEADQVIYLEGMPLYVSCKLGKSRYELIQALTFSIKAQHFTPSSIILLQGTSANISHPDYRKQVEEKNPQIINFCSHNLIQLVWHQNSTSLLETLKQAIMPAVTSTSANQEHLLSIFS